MVVHWGYGEKTVENYTGVFIFVLPCARRKSRSVVLHQNKHLPDKHSQDKGKRSWIPDEIRGLEECTDSYFLVMLKEVIKY